MHFGHWLVFEFITSRNSLQNWLYLNKNKKYTKFKTMLRLNKYKFIAPQSHIDAFCTPACVQIQNFFLTGKVYLNDFVKYYNNDNN